MKVIKKGRPQKGWSKKYTCTGKGNNGGGCGAKLLVEAGDLFQTASHHYDGSSESYVTFKCPECGVLTDISDSDIPSGLVLPKKPPSDVKPRGMAG